MQIVKPRAQLIAGTRAWDVKHPSLRGRVIAKYPHDGAVVLIEEHIVHHQCAPKRGGGGK